MSSLAPSRLVLVDSGESPRQETLARFGWCEKALHVQFDVEEASVQSDFMERNDPVYLGDCVELFLDPWGHGKVYFEINVSPNNVVYDALILNRTIPTATKRDILPLVAWDCEGLVSEVVLTPERYRVMLSIPWRQLAPPCAPGPGVSWRFNAYRIDRRSGSEEDDEFQALSPTGRRDFHVPGAFAWLDFRG